MHERRDKWIDDYYKPLNNTTKLELGQSEFGREKPEGRRMSRKLDPDAADYEE